MSIKIVSVEGKGQKFDTAKDVEALVRQIAECQDLEELKLSGHTYGIEASEAIANALKNKPTIQVCTFSDMFTGRLRSEIPKCLAFFTEALLDKEKLRVLDLSDNAFGADALRPVLPLIINRTSLEVLKLNNTGLGPSGGNLLAEGLMGAHKKNQELSQKSNLRVFVCGRSRLENGSMKALAEAFKSHGHLREVVIPQDGIRSEGIVDILEGLSACKDLEVLNMQDNTFTAMGSRAFAKAIPNWTKMRELNVGDCMMTSKGVQPVFKELYKGAMPQLTSFNLQYNEVAEPEILYLATVIPKLKSLKTLVLNGNRFAADSAPADAIRSALEEIGADDALDSLSDMEEDYDEDEEEQEDEEADELAEELATTAI